MCPLILNNFLPGLQRQIQFGNIAAWCKVTQNSLTTGEYREYNLGWNKKEINSPTSAKINNEFASKAKRTIFPSLKLGGRGGLNTYKIVALLNSVTVSIQV